MSPPNRIPHLAGRGLLAFATMAGIQAGAAHASSHREAPFISGEPRLDSTDFYMFRSYEPKRAGYVTLVANYNPLQDPFGGPNYFALDPQAVYDINIDNVGDGQEHITFRFQFKNSQQGIALNIGGQNVEVPLINVGQVGVAGDPNSNAALNVHETYTVTMIRTESGITRTAWITDAATGANVFTKPVDNIGLKSLPDYAAYADNLVYTVKIPGCGTGRLFAGQRKDPFVVNLGQTFDLINYANPVGEVYANSTHDDLVDKNVTSLIMEVPAACLTAGDPVIGGWTAASKVIPTGTGTPMLAQQSRLANPLVTELLIGLEDKDHWGESRPAAFDGTNFLIYMTNPTLPAIIESLFGTPAPTAFPRQDLPAVFLTGIKGVNQPAKFSRMADELRLNTSIGITAYGAQSRLGVIGGDNAGYPNGRRPGDDVVDIALRVVMGRLYTLGLFGSPSDAPSGALDFTDGAYVDDTFFDQSFPYLKTPIAGSPGPQPN